MITIKKYGCVHAYVEYICARVDIIHYEKKSRHTPHSARKVTMALMRPVVYLRFYSSYPAAPI